MFSCALFHAGSDEPLPAKDSKTSVNLIGATGEGTATCSYTVDEDTERLLLYIPSLISVRSVTRQYVRLSNCKISVARGTGGKTVAQPLRLARVDDLQLRDAASLYNPRDNEVPDYSELRRHYKSSAAKLCGSLTSEDVLLHVGDLPGGSQLTVRFEFLVRFSSSSQCPPLQYNIRQSLPSLQHSYNLLLAAPCPVANVTTTGLLASFSWEHLCSGNEHSNLVQVSYTTTMSNRSKVLPGLNIHFDYGLSGGCCTLPAPSTGGLQNSLLAPYDGVMMMSSVFTPCQLPSSLKLPPYLPSEFVFVIDCSGSMSGTNIQTAADTLIMCIKSLPPGCCFNVIAFGSTYRKLFHSSEVYSETSMESAITFAYQLQASLGGTELLGPLHWIFKTQRRSGLPCQVFVITDGGVTNTTSVLRCVRKNRHQARCHTFGIGGEVCVELVTGIAAASGGQCVLLSPTQRLQTKVMEVLKDSMQPSMSNVVLKWHPPKGYTVVGTSPRNLGTLFTGNSYSAFAFLRRSYPMLNGSHDGYDDVIAPTGTATLVGLVNGEQVNIDIDPVTLPPLSTLQNKEMTMLLSRSATWSRLCDLELQTLSSSRKNSQNDSNEECVSEPPTKKPRLNGVHPSPPPLHTQQKPILDNPLGEELTELSLRSGILCPMTYLESVCGKIRQIVPVPPSKLVKPTHVTHCNGGTAIHSRKRKHYDSKHCHASLSNATFTVSSFAKNTISAISNTLKTVANITTFGLVGQETSPPIENGTSIEDEIEYQEKRHSQLHWDETKGNIVYPDIYYRSHPGKHHNRPNGSATENHHRIKRSRHSRCFKHTHQSILHVPAASDHHFAETGNDSGEEDQDLTISDTESDSSVDPDWDDLHKPNELLPIIHIQLFNGAWPLIRAFSYAVGVPLEEIRKLPLSREAPDCNKTLLINKEKAAQLWATAVALVCLEENFSEFQSEWEVVAYKGRSWIERELLHTELSLEEMQRTARELMLRQS